MRDDQTIYRRNSQVRYDQMQYGRQVEPERRPSFVAGTLVGILVSAAIVGAFVLGSGMFSRIVNKIVPARQAVAMQTQSGSATQTGSTTQVTVPSEAPDQMLSNDEAINCAVGHVAYGNDVRNAGAQLVVGGDAPHYVVDFDFDDAHYTVTVDAYSGDVWDVQTSYPSGGEVSEEQPVEEETNAVWDEDVE